MINIEENISILNEKIERKTSIIAVSKKKSADLVEKPQKKGLFGRKKEPIKVNVKPKKNGLFGKKVETVIVAEEPKKKGWFR